MTIATEYQREITKLRERNEWLEAELALRSDNHLSRMGEIMTRLKISKTQANLLAALATGGVMTREMIAETCGYPDNYLIRNIDCHVKKMRKKIRPIGIDVIAVYGVGYACEGDKLARLRSLIGEIGAHHHGQKGH